MRTTKPRRPLVDRLAEPVGDWEGVRVVERRHGGWTFRLDGRELGHVHASGLVDIDFTRELRDLLVRQGRTGPHHVFPNTGWTSYRLREESDLPGALWLLRLSYCYHAQVLARRGRGPTLDLDGELRELRPGAGVRAVLVG